jgi:hypothetical protein
VYSIEPLQILSTITEKRKKQINWNTRENWFTLKRNSEFLNTQIRGMIDELELNRENWQGSCLTTRVGCTATCLVFAGTA